MSFPVNPISILFRHPARHKALLLLLLALWVCSFRVQPVQASPISNISVPNVSGTITPSANGEGDLNLESDALRASTPDKIAASLIDSDSAATNSPANAPKSALYTAAQRWGYSFDPHGDNNTFVSLADFNHAGIKGVFFQDWNYTNAQGPYSGLEYFPMVGAYTVYLPQQCSDVTNTVKQNSGKYPNGTRWIVGNEIGFDIVPPMSPQAYAQHFLNWRDCIKKINASFLVGSGAILDQKIILPGKGGACSPTLKFNDGTNYSGYSYWVAYLDTIKSLYPNDSTKLPDFYTAHGYMHCAPASPPGNSGWWNVKYFKTEIRNYRKLLNAEGERNKELIINEFSPLYHDPSIKITAVDYMQFLCRTGGFMLTATDPLTGNPNDGNRLVQRWMWYNLNVGFLPDAHFPALALINNKNLVTKLGRGYNALASAPVPPANCASWAASIQ